MLSQLQQVMTSFSERPLQSINPENPSNPYDWMGLRHNKILTQIAENIPAVIVYGRTSLNRTRTEDAIEAVAASADLQIVGRSVTPKHFTDVRPPRTSLFDLADDPIAFLRRIFSEGGISEIVRDAIVAYLDSARFTRCDLAAFVEMTREAEKVVLASALSEEDQARLLGAFAVGRHSAVYWFAEQNDVSSKWDTPCLCDSSVPHPQFVSINWWKVLAADCIMGAASLGNPAVAAGGSACSVVSQL